MSDFKVDGKNVNEIMAKLKTIQSKMDSSYDRLSTLVTNIETEKEWAGQAHDEFLAFMQLMKQFHGDFSSETDDNCVAGAIKALNNFSDNMDAFETDNPDFVNMKGIS